MTGPSGGQSRLEYNSQTCIEPQRSMIHGEGTEGTEQKQNKKKKLLQLKETPNVWKWKPSFSLSERFIIQDSQVLIHMNHLYFIYLQGGHWQNQCSLFLESENFNLVGSATRTSFTWSNECWTVTKAFCRVSLVWTSSSKCVNGKTSSYYYCSNPVFSAVHANMHTQ